MAKYSFKKEINIEDGYDVVVAGGGMAGAAAAICAARLGAKTLLVEATGCLGGMGTSGLVCAFDPMSDGERMIVGGLMREIVETLYEKGFLEPGFQPDDWEKTYSHWTPFNPEGLKLVLDEKAVDAGVEIRFFTKVIEADAAGEQGRINGVIINNIEGYSYIKAKTFIDATGDAVLSDLCGAAYRAAGRDTEKIMAATLASLFANIDWGNDKRLLSHRFPNVVDWIEQEYAQGNFSQCDRHLAGMYKIGHSIGYLNATHIFNMDSTKIKELSEGMIKGRKLVREYEEFFKKYSPNCRNIELVATGSLMGLRESRRVMGEYDLVFDDYINCRQFPDQIGVLNKFVDIHPYDCSKAEYERFMRESKEARMGKGECFGLPYGIIVPKNWKNLWVAGRCSSSDIRVNGAIRVMPPAAMMGQAAGTAAVQSIRTGQPACDLDTEELVKTLRDNGAYLPQKNLCKNMTRS